MSKPVIACIIAPEKFRDEELFVPKAAFEKAGYQTVIASTRIGTASGMLGGFAIATCPIADLHAAELAALVVVGGSGSHAHLWGHAGLHALAREMSAAGKPVAAICISPAVLARAGILKGRKATVFKDEASIAELEKGEAIYEPQSCIVDGNIITASGPEAAAEFANEVLRLLRASSR
ncbi:DJ-1/PfpI family protein [Candidatus Ozemobacteraceae bacterium]|nr:DJ-1/PfpI family protein [Candidatus Ozemobacteraceae bacterium]